MAGTTRSKRAAIATKKISSLQLARTRLPQKQELFAQIYKDIIKPNVTDAIEAENATTPGEKLGIIKHVQKEAYENASVEVKEEIKRILAKMVLEKASLKQLDNAITVRTPKEYQECIHISFVDRLLDRFRHKGL